MILNDFSVKKTGPKIGLVFLMASPLAPPPHRKGPAIK